MYIMVMANTSSMNIIELNARGIRKAYVIKYSQENFEKCLLLNLF